MTRIVSFKAAAVAAAAWAVLGVAATAQAASTTYVFDYPAIGGPGVPHTPVATLTLTEIAGGVRFLLQPDWNVVGTGAHWDELQLAYQGPALADLSFADLGPAIIDVGKMAVTTGSHAGYDPDVSFLGIHWDNTGQNHHFDFTHGTSSWQFTGAGLTLDDFTGSFAWAGNKISPIHGVLSGQGISGDSQNWVSAAPIPEPSTYAMLLAGLAVMGLVARRRAG